MKINDGEIASMDILSEQMAFVRTPEGDRWVPMSEAHIAFSRKCSTAIVRTVIDRAKVRGLEWPLPEEMNDAAIRAVIYPRKPKADAAKAEIDHAGVDKEMGRPGVTVMIPWSEYCAAALASGKESYMYARSTGTGPLPTRSPCASSAGRARRWRSTCITTLFLAAQSA